MIFIIRFLILIMLFCVCYIIYIFLRNFCTDYEQNAIKLTFKSFYSLYQVNPNRWKIYTEYPEYYKKYNELYAIYADTQPIKFNAIDGAKYRRFVKKRLKKEFQEQDIYRTQELINSVKQDIETFEERNKKETQEKLEKLYGGMKKL